MNHRKYNQFRIIVSIFVAGMVSVSVIKNSYLLASVSAITGIIFLSLVRAKAKIRVDEREISIQEKAAHLTYTIFAPTIGIGAYLLLFPSHSGLSVFSKGNYIYLESLGMVFAYLTLFLITLFSISYHYLNQKYGGGNEE